MLSGTLIGFRAGQATLSGVAKTHITWAVIWAIVSLFFGAVNLSYVPSRVLRFDVTTDMWIAIFGGFQLVLMIAAGVRIVLAVLATIS
jgi:hypothetical protein